jgi:hypothetical protein
MMSNGRKYAVVFTGKVRKNLEKSPATHSGQILHPGRTTFRTGAGGSKLAELQQAWQQRLSLPFRVFLGGVLDS